MLKLYTVVANEENHERAGENNSLNKPWIDVSITECNVYVIIYEYT